MTPLRRGGAFRVLTERDVDALAVLRHSAAHVLATAVRRLRPDAKIGFGPAIEDGFYYDFEVAQPFTPEDLEKFEAEMRKVVAEKYPFVREEVGMDEARKRFVDDPLKLERLDDFTDPYEIISTYTDGPFVDLCRGPHVPDTGKLKAFKLMKTAGAYWRGDSDNAMLSRIYGTAWLNDKDLKAYLTRIEEAEKRDHRKLGKQLDLFHMQEEAPGMAFWHAKGWTLWQQVEQYMRRVYRDSGYQEVRCPSILDVSLWKKSGHWDNYKDNMFFTESEKRTYAVKPMNCPGHVQIYNDGLHSYRDLPIRYGEFGSCTRNEPSGALHGLLRVRSFTQDDGHIFCTEDQIEQEVVDFHRQALKVYEDFGFTNVELMLALRPESRIGDDAVWDKSEDALRAALRRAGAEWKELPGEGAFYGPKIEYHLRDAIGRDWQLGTMQVDFSMPGRLGAEYVGEDSQRHTPVMLHRAIVGSMERFLGILIEHHAGNFPTWLAPVQAVVMNITDSQAEYAAQAAANLNEAGFRVEADLRNEKIGYKIREHTLQKVPWLLVVGDREKERGTVSVRTRSGEDLGSMSLPGFIQRLEAEPRPR
jgi:threonyl-tRNA synthetase